MQRTMIQPTEIGPKISFMMFPGTDRVKINIHTLRGLPFADGKPAGTDSFSLSFRELPQPAELGMIGLASELQFFPTVSRY
jgi:hypothetical protein